MGATKQWMLEEAYAEFRKEEEKREKEEERLALEEAREEDLLIEKSIQSQAEEDEEERLIEEAIQEQIEEQEREKTNKTAEIGYNVKAIETKYAGTIFRSRLEARWAAFFDVLRWSWIYEPFDLDGWFPDFLLKPVSPNRAGILVEVKPISEFCKDTANQIEKALFKTNNELEPMLVGLEPIFHDETWENWEGSKIGWLAKRCADPYCEAESDVWAWGRAPLRDFLEPQKNLDTNGGLLADFCHEEQDYTGRMTNYHEGNVGYMSPNICRYYWGEACNKVKYQPKEITNARY